MAKRRLPKFHPFTPVAQQAIPPGLYDPVLDATLGQAKRGYQDVVSGAQTQVQRLQTDYGLGLDTINRDQTRGGEDLAAQESGLNRSYGQLATAQGEQQNAYGVLTGGAALQAARKRAENRAWDQKPIDVARTRLGENADLARGNLALQMAPPDAANPLGGRAFQDIGTSLATGARELGALGIDTERAKAYSASQNGYVPPKLPHNEQTNPLTGGTTREYTINGVVYTVGKGGKIIRKRKA